eukprot:SAG31_NODE_446_length_15587_cov_29.651989_2_plen_1247_part_00
MASAVLPAKHRGSNAIELDNYNIYNEWGACGSFSGPGGAWIQRYNAAAPEADHQYAIDVLNWTKRFVEASHKVGMLVLPNWSVTNFQNDDVAEAVGLFDGIFAESGFVDWSPVPNTTSFAQPPLKTTPESFEQQVLFIRHLQRLGKAYFSFNGWGPGKLYHTAAWRSSHKLLPPVAVEGVAGRAIRQFIVASYMITNGGACAIELTCVGCYAGCCGGLGNFSIWPEYSAEVGSPSQLEPRKDPQTGVWSRAYTSGFAVVNPSNTSRVATLPKQQGVCWMDLYGTEVSMKVTLPPTSGQVFVMKPADDASSASSAAHLKIDDSDIAAMKGSNVQFANPTQPPPSPAALQCQAKLDAFCNNFTLNGDCCTSQNGSQCLIRGRVASPFFARYDRDRAKTKEWRCFSHLALSADHTHWQPDSTDPAALCSMHVALRAICAKCSAAPPNLPLSAPCLPRPPPPPPPPPPPGVQVLRVFVPGMNSHDCTSNFAKRPAGEACEYAGFRIPGLVALGDGVIMAFAEGRKYTASDHGRGRGHGQHDMVMRVSSDHGQSFSNLSTILDALDFPPWRAFDAEGGIDDGNAVWDPTPLYDLHTKTAWLFFNGPGRETTDCAKGLCATWAAKSTDLGKHWVFKNVTDQCHRARNGSGWAEGTAMSTGNGHGIQLSNGTLVVPMFAGLPQGAGLCLSHNHGESWHATRYNANVGVNSDEIEVAELPPPPAAGSNDHDTTTTPSLYMTIRNDDVVGPGWCCQGSEGGRQYSLSFDMGQTWSKRSNVQVPDSGTKGSVLWDVQADHLLLSVAACCVNRVNTTIFLSKQRGEPGSFVYRQHISQAGGYSTLAMVNASTVAVLFEEEWTIDPTASGKPAGSHAVLGHGGLSLGLVATQTILDGGDQGFVPCADAHCSDPARNQGRPPPPPAELNHSVGYCKIPGFKTDDDTSTRLAEGKPPLPPPPLPPGCPAGAAEAVAGTGLLPVTLLGAKGDGWSDDLAAIQGAVECVYNLGGVVFFPPGFYFINGTLVLRERRDNGTGSTGIGVVLQGSNSPTSGKTATGRAGGGIVTGSFRPQTRLSNCGGAMTVAQCSESPPVIQIGAFNKKVLEVGGKGTRLRDLSVVGGQTGILVLSSANIVFQNVGVEAKFNTSSPDNAAMVITDVFSLYFHGCSFVNPTKSAGAKPSLILRGLDTQPSSADPRPVHPITKTIWNMRFVACGWWYGGTQWQQLSNDSSQFGAVMLFESSLMEDSATPVSDVALIR